MSIRNEQELGVTRGKLHLLEERVAALKRQTGGDAHVRELTLRSLKSMMNQLLEEITRFAAAGAGAGSTNGSGEKRMS